MQYKNKALHTAHLGEMKCIKNEFCVNKSGNIICCYMNSLLPVPRCCVSSYPSVTHSTVHVPYNRKGRVVVVVAAIAHTTDNPLPWRTGTETCNSDHYFPKQSMERGWWICYSCVFPAWQWCRNFSCLTDISSLPSNRWWLYFVSIHLSV